MNEFNPLSEVKNCELILNDNEWPNFHDAEIHTLSIWRGDVRPDENVWIGPVIQISFELCALKEPYLAVIKFHDCQQIKLKDFNHQNALYDLNLAYEERGTLNNGEPMTPYIVVKFEHAFGAELSFKCFKIEAMERRNLG